jgi:diguanylate cyclase (GGDEF)-like protein
VLNRWWILPLGWFTCFVVPYLLLPPSVQGPVYLGTGLLVVGAVLRARRATAAEYVRSWTLLSLAYGCVVVGILVRGVELALTSEPPFPAWSDVFYLSFYVPLLVAVTGILRSRWTDLDRADWLDAAIWVCGAAVIAWQLSLQSYIGTAGHTSVLAVTVATAYPLLDLVLLLLMVRVVASDALRSVPLQLMAAGLGVLLTTDVMYLGHALGPGYELGGMLDVGWLTSYVLVAAAGCHEATTRGTAPVVAPHAPAPSSRRRIPLLLVPAMAGPAVVAHLAWTRELASEVDDVLVALGATVVILMLAAARGSGLIRLADERAAALQVRVDQDALTGLANRDRFVGELSVALSEPGCWSVLFLDLDDFKNVNDSMGHGAGDVVLCEVAARLRQAAPDSRVVARFGGDEFALLVPAVDVDATVRRIQHALQAPMLVEGREVEPGGSIGVATTEASSTVTDLLRQADVAMYDAKRSGRAWAQYQPDMSATLIARLDLRSQLVQALADGEIVPWFQPVVDLRTGRLAGFEALARWIPPGREPVRPDAWLPLAEESGLVVAVDRAVMEAAIAQLARWTERCDLPGLHVAINLSGRTLQREGIEDDVLMTLLQARLSPERLVVEVTEGVLIEDEEVSPRLQRLRAAGVRIALDDFGTGWSSLGYLRRFPVDQLKLDRSFTSELGAEEDADAIPAAVIQLAGALGLDVVAEGVETEVQRERLVQLGFGVAQGFLFAPARPAEVLDGWLDGVVDAAALDAGGAGEPVSP